ncbi:MAG: DNA gyrase subunit A [Bdellovibrionales bacterium]|nr:DNA gyrase subunit A [Bdellovibrionales bacterium]
METNQIPPPENKNVEVRHIEEEMRGAYLDYAMSVIIGRALPDVRDGLKPVHRRALYAMYDLGNTYNKPYKKSARVVGDVIGKYHPHGDLAVYDTIVRMAQDFSLRYPLIDGQGNFGSIDGDSAAAMRYTEIRMNKITDELLADLEKETVDFGPNYDGSIQEPLVFPTKIPNLLVNGSTGIAVGMATNIPPHNLTEVIDATLALIQNPALTVDNMMEYVKGPDFPTGGIVFGGNALKLAYKTGRAVITVRAKTEIETFKNDRERIVVSELPYQVNKARLIERIADLVNEDKLEGISDIRDESDRTGMRVVIEIKKNESSSIVLNRLFKMTQLQDSFGIALLAIDHHQPKMFNLRDMIQAFIEHRKDVVIRRTVFDLRKAEQRLHILEGLKRAVESLDAVITLIRASANAPEALNGLMSKFSFTQIQAQAILDMRLQRLTGLERDKIIEEYNEVMKLIGTLKDILANEPLVLQIISTELQEIKEKYGDERRTEIQLDETSNIEIEDLITDEATLVSITRTGYIKRQDPSQFKTQGRGGKGIIGATTSDEDFVTQIFQTTTHSNLFCLTDLGRLHVIKVYKAPEGNRTSKGKAIVNLLTLQAEEKVMMVLPVLEFDENKFLIMATKKGVVKKTALSEYRNIRTTGINAISIDDGDQLMGARITDGNQEIFLTSAGGMSIRFSEKDVRPMGRTAYGVNGMALDDGDSLVGMDVISPNQEGAEILVVSELGYGKRTPISEYKTQGRGGKGIITMKVTDKIGNLVSAREVKAKDDLMLFSSRGKLIRISIGEIRETGRNASGVRLMNVENGEKVVAVENLPAMENIESGGDKETLH